MSAATGLYITLHKRAFQFVNGWGGFVNGNNLVAPLELLHIKQPCVSFSFRSFNKELETPDRETSRCYPFDKKQITEKY
ncbi:MAG: hypothetical protein IPJ86_07395 [Bacteroidetes bacterium]|nr:hypothetical protein [Bacteroidota bacterium]